MHGPGGVAFAQAGFEHGPEVAQGYVGADSHSLLGHAAQIAVAEVVEARIVAQAHGRGKEYAFLHEPVAP